MEKQVQKSLRGRAVFLVASFALFTLIGLAVWQYSTLSRARQLLYDDALSRRQAVDLIVKERESSLRNFVSDTSIHDELFATGEEVKADIGHSQNISERSGTHGYWVYSSDLKTLSAWRDSGLSELTAEPLDIKDIPRVFNESNVTRRFFRVINSRVLEIAGQKVELKGEESLEHQSGYLIAVREWNRDRLDSIGSALQCLVTVTTKPKKGFEVNEANGFHTYYIPLHGEDGTPVGSVEFAWSNSAIGSMIETTQFSTMAFGLVSVLPAGLLIAALVFWVVRPLRNLVGALEEGKLELVQPMSFQQDELGLLARLVIAHHEQNEEIHQLNEELEHRVRERTEELQEAYDATILGWSRAMDSRDEETAGHTQRVAEMAMHIGRAMKLSEPELDDLYKGALLHDIGKIGVPDSVLLKAGPLTDSERKVIEGHTTLAYKMLQPIKFLQRALYVPWCHHERWDGNGYPRKLAGDQIPFLARVFAVADVWDALRSDRPYRKAWSEQETREYIAAKSGEQFDPAVVEAFLATEPLPHPTDVQFEGWRQNAA